MDNVLVLTRTYVEDFNIFKIWHEYYSRFFKHIGCCIFKRKREDISDIIKFCKKKKIYFSILEREIFNNQETIEILKQLSQELKKEINFVVDCDEFFNDFLALKELMQEATEKQKNFLLEMVDRVSEDGKLYNISSCKKFEDLLMLAPNTGDLTKNIQKWETFRCSINLFPWVGDIHYPEKDQIANKIYTVSLLHFKWRTEWSKKASRRITELNDEPWKKGIKSVKKHFNNVGKFRNIEQN